MIAQQLMDQKLNTNNLMLLKPNTNTLVGKSVMNRKIQEAQKKMEKMHKKSGKEIE